MTTGEYLLSKSTLNAGTAMELLLHIQTNTGIVVNNGVSVDINTLELDVEVTLIPLEILVEPLALEIMVVPINNTVELLDNIIIEIVTGDVSTELINNIEVEISL